MVTTEDEPICCVNVSHFFSLSGEVCYFCEIPCCVLMLGLANDRYYWLLNTDRDEQREEVRQGVQHKLHANDIQGDGCKCFMLQRC